MKVKGECSSKSHQGCKISGWRPEGLGKMLKVEIKMNVKANLLKVKIKMNIKYECKR